MNERAQDSATDVFYAVTLEQGRPAWTVHGPGCEAVTGYTAGELQADPSLWHRIAHSEDRLAVAAQADRILKGEAPPPLEHRIIHKSGAIRWIRNTPVIREDDLGRMIACDGLISDITERKAVEEQHRLRAAQMQAILDNSPAIIHLKDAQGRYILTNRRFQQLFHLSAEEVLGKTPHDLFPRETASVLCNHDKKVRAALAPLEFEETLSHDGEPHTYLSVKFPLLDAAGVPYALCGISTDITGRKQAAEQLERVCAELFQNEAALKTALEQLQLANKNLQATQAQLIQAAKLELVGTLAAGVAHEVKNPLQTILMGVDYLASGLPRANDNITLVLSDMRDAVTRANAIVRDLLELSAATAFEPVEEDLSSLVERSLRLVKSETVASKIHVSCELSPNLPPVLLDRRKMEQVFINLFLNALQAMSQGGVLTVATRHGRFGQDLKMSGPAFAHFQPGELVVIAEVRDTGKGIPEEHLPKIFDPFFTTKAVGVGTGLGLSVVKNIVDLHGGAIAIHNAPPGGAVVTLVLKTQHNQA